MHSQTYSNSHPDQIRAIVAALAEHGITYAGNGLHLFTAAFNMLDKNVYVHVKQEYETKIRTLMGAVPTKITYTYSSYTSPEGHRTVTPSLNVEYPEGFMVQFTRHPGNYMYTTLYLPD